MPRSNNSRPIERPWYAGFLERVAMKSLRERDIKNLIHFHTNMARHEQIGPMIIVRGDGIRIIDDSGNSYIDTVSGLWSASLGFSNQRLADAAHRQFLQLPFYHAFNHKSHPKAIELSERLIQIAPVPMARVLFQSSGSEAIETACKLVWQYFIGKGMPKKIKIFSRWGSYHGATVAAAALSGQHETHQSFNLPLERFRHANSPNFIRMGRPTENEAAFASRMAEELETQILREGPESCAAMVIDPVQISAGVILPPATYHEKIQAVLKRHGMLLIADEVATGFGRTGAMWGSEIYGIRPDMLVCAKALTASYMPLSALLISDAVYDVLRARTVGGDVFAHGFTHGTHPVAIAVALEALDIYDEMGLVQHVKALGAEFQSRFAQLGMHSLVRDISGIGLAAGFGIAPDATAVARLGSAREVTRAIENSAKREGLVVRAMGDRIAMAPPFITTSGDLDEIFRRFLRSLDAVAQNVEPVSGISRHLS